jgi:MoaA/NifB/PqqE/SkfB family radical SAM enzyme
MWWQAIRSLRALMQKGLHVIFGVKEGQMQVLSEQQEQQKPGFVEFKHIHGKPKIDDLWFMLGSRCNLSCKHCYVGSSPTNDTLQQMTLGEVKRFLEEAKGFGLEHVYFTGGEPFINNEILEILEEALKYGDVTVLTNATFPISKFILDLKGLQERSENNLTFRVSLDHYEKERHDAIRGNGTFRFTTKNVKALSEAGFKPIITATAVVYENNTLSEEEIIEKFKAVFREEGIEVEVKLLPYNLEMGTNLQRILKPSKHVFISEGCMKRAGVDMANFQCFNGRTVQKINEKMVVYPCPIIYKNPQFEMADNFEDSFKKVFLTHKACFDFCYKSGGKCTN